MPRRLKELVIGKNIRLGVSDIRVVEVNAGFRGSTGNIMLSIAELVRTEGGEAYTFSGVKSEPLPTGHSYFGTNTENLVHRVFSVFTGISGKGSKKGTKELLKKIDEINPDILHFHNLHGWFINLPMLFDYVKENKIKTVWTLHDCWGFTAQCSHFTMEKCEKWKTGCYKCPRYRLYPYTFVDKTHKMWPLKKKWVTGVENMTVVTPSKWLADLAKQSFLGEYDIKVINNGIDLNVFKPTKSDFCEKNNLNNKKIVLGVASSWSDRKGIDVFKKLAETLDDEYQIILVGTNDEIDKTLPKNIISIHRTNNQTELAEIYTAANVFVNPTREETFGLVNLEAIACGTPVVTFNVGGTPETVDEKTGIIIDCDDFDGLKNAISKLAIAGVELSDCIKHVEKFWVYKKFQEYINLYKDILS